ncbi:tyrosine recombinase [Bacteroidia bacterium]|nr:tyrosine recombinase [Bacteroidia bacterium]
MKISIVLDTRRALKDGRYPVKFRFSYGSKKDYVPTGLSAFTEEWDEEARQFSLRDKNTQAKHRNNNNMLMHEFERAEDILRDLKRKGRGNIPPDKFKELFLHDDNSSEISFDAFFMDFIDTKTGRTKHLYENTLKKIKQYFPKVLYFEDVDYPWLQRFETELKDRGNAVNTISIDMRNVRAVFREATKRKIVSKDLYPFDDFRIKQEETEHRNVSVEKLRALFAYSGTKSENWARDVAKLIFFLMGINVTDLFDLSAPTDGRINYRRDKTGRLYSIKVEPEMAALFDKFKGKTHFLCFQEQFQSKAYFTNRLNGRQGTDNQGNQKIYQHGLKTIGYAIGVDNLTSYVLRHTWATVASYLDIPESTIKRCLGHGAKTVTDTYINFDRTKIDAANRKVMDFVFNEKSPLS